MSAARCLKQLRSLLPPPRLAASCQRHGVIVTPLIRSTGRRIYSSRSISTPISISNRNVPRSRSTHTLSRDEVGALIPTMSDLGLREGDHVTVAMSGGVDSATTLRILSEFPIEIDVVFMRNWDPLLSESPSSEASSSLSPSATANPRLSLAYPSSSNSTSNSNSSKGRGRGGGVSIHSPCEWERDWTDVLRAATHIGIHRDKIRLVDLSKEYWTRVFEPAVNIWQNGGTPNPDVDCNREIKFGALLDLLPQRERHFLATGHYARVDRSDPQVNARLFRATDPAKDQTYYLSQMTQRHLSRTVLPLGRITKPSVRKLAEYWDLPNAKKEESMGVCFIGERGKFGDFISQYTSPPEPGHLVLPSGERLAPHKGLWYYTIGQRAKIANQSQAMFVAQKGVGESGLDIMVVPGQAEHVAWHDSDHPMLLCEEIHTADFHWIHGSPPEEVLATLDNGAGEDADGEQLLIQVRHRMTPVPAIIRLDSRGSRRLIVRPLEPLPGVSPGQVVAIWKGEWCLGSGLIRDTKCLEGGQVVIS